MVSRTPIPSVNSTTYNHLSGWKQRQIDEVADILLNSTGGYHGSESDARTDATAIVLAMQFSPTGDNHHNAALCPYCSPDPRDDGQ